MSDTVTLYDRRVWVDENGFICCHSTKFGDYIDHNLTLCDGSKIINFYDHKDAEDLKDVIEEMIGELESYLAYLENSDLKTS